MHVEEEEDKLGMRLAAEESAAKLRVELEAYAKTHAHRFKLVHVVGHGKDDSPEGWDGEKGWIDEEKVRRYAFPPAADTNVFVCGLPAMYDVLCGPRGEAEVLAGTVLHRIGYRTEMVTKF